MPLLKHTRWAVLKNAVVDHLTAHQLNALGELLAQGFDTATARRVKERLKWIHQVRTPPGRTLAYHPLHQLCHPHGG